MHPLSVFPQLFYLGLLAPFLLRVVVGLYLSNIGFERYRKPYKWTSVLYGISGLFVLVGLFTQIAIIVGVLIVAFDFYVEKQGGQISKERIIIYVFVCTILLSLLFTGPGAFAFDLPL